jgi:hypothetical protein
MGWIKLVAPEQRQKPVGAVVSLRVGKHSSSLYVTLSSAAAGAHGWDAFEHCDAFFGEGENAGKLRLEPAKDGLIYIKRHKAVMMRIPEQKGWPNESRKFGLMGLEWDGSAAIVTLPMALTNPRQAMTAVPAAALPSFAAQARKGAPPGLEITGNIVSLGQRHARLEGGMQAKIFNRLAQDWARPVSDERLIHALYGDDPNGGPDGAAGTLKVFILKLRKALAPLGLVIINSHGTGYSLCLSPEAKASMFPEPSLVALVPDGDGGWRLKIKLRQLDGDEYDWPVTPKRAAQLLRRLSEIAADGLQALEKPPPGA